MEILKPGITYFLLQEGEDQDWARAQALRESKTVEEVVFSRAVDNGMLVSLSINLIYASFRKHGREACLNLGSFYVTFSPICKSHFPFL